MTEFNLLAGGPPASWPADLPQKKAAHWLAADRGALRLLKLGITPQIAVGDFDSLAPAELTLLQNQVTDIRYAVADKDETDTELALAIALNELKATRVTLYGATGGRLDHLLDNLFMLLQPRFLADCQRVRLLDRQNSFRLFLPGVHTITQESGQHYLAFAPMTAVTGLTLYDTKYQLRDADFSQPIMFASNQFTKKSATFSFRTGVVAVVQSHD
ncbi:thiamine diphosphokinase [Loigolactobacillus zhaoyuanensis]|uniref:Thiamine diphosphokinase n=1 Tax=Loigolactobacillus zhaoyuanensis TaxID=2486017 RepID=A0ABW8U923_9LACO|nr:thiamine diphosphokinase [Loigolactobacillus zhaoyuanensis]